MDERFDVIVSEFLIFIANVRNFVCVLFTHSLESILFIDEFLDFVIFHLSSEYSADQPVVLREHTQRCG
jgi:hypothetical protein